MIKQGDRYKLVRHPSTPIGKIIQIDQITDHAIIEWDDQDLIPPYEKYPIRSFKDGTFSLVEEFNFTYVGGDLNCYDHQWQHYIGLMEEYDFCKTCGMKRYGSQ